MVRIALIASFFCASAAQAVDCNIDIQDAYHEATRNGYGFVCANGVLTFDNQKRMGCTLKTGILPSKYEIGYFFYDPEGAQLNSGWRISDYQMVGGTFNKQNPTPDTLIKFQFRVNGMGRIGRRYISALTFSRNGGNCANVLQEAF